MRAGRWPSARRPRTSLESSEAGSSLPPVSLLCGAILVLVKLRQLHRVEQLGDLRLSENLALANDLEDPLAALVRLVRQLGRLVVTQHRVERRRDADGGLHVV